MINDTIPQQNHKYNILPIVFQPGDVVETRILDAPKAKTIAGYFNDWDKLQQEVSKHDGRGNIYITLNPANPALLARANNRLIERPKNTTTDTDITERRWLLVDCDPVRPAGIMATNEEKQAAQDKIKQVYAFLKGKGWPDPVVCDSGSGYHFLYRINLPNDNQSKELLSECLKALSLKFDDQQVNIDKAVFNAARITRLYGTMNCKGENIPERPHRRSGIIKIPDEMKTVSKEQLEALAAMYPKPQTDARRSYGDQFDIRKWMSDNGLMAREEKQWNNTGTIFVLETCPFDAAHSKDSRIIQFNNGALSFGCFHNGCAGNDWYSLRDLVEPGWREARKEKEQLWQKTREITADKAVMLGKQLSIVNMADVQPEEVDFLWKPYLPLGKLSIMEGNPGEGKTFAALAIASSVTTGVPFVFERGRTWEMREPGNVLYLTAEDGAADTIRPRLDKQGADASRVWVVTGTQQDGNQGVYTFDDIPLLEGCIKQISPKLVVVDPIQAYMGSGVDMHRANETRPILAKLAVLAERYKCVILCIRHLSKNNASKALFRGMGSIDFTAAARSVLLVGADSQDPTRKAMVHIKSSLAQAGEPQGYELTEGGFYWTGASTVTAMDILGAEDEKEKGALEDACEWLEEFLSGGPKLKPAIDKEAEKKQIKPRTLRRAREKLNIKVYKPPGSRYSPWVWSLPDETKPGFGQVIKMDSARKSIVDSGTEVKGIKF